MPKIRTLSDMSFTFCVIGSVLEFSCCVFILCILFGFSILSFKKYTLQITRKTIRYTAGQGSGGVSTNAVVSPFDAFIAMGVKVVYDEGKTAAAAAAVAASADIAIIFGHAESAEGRDRANLTLHGNIDEIIPSVAKVQPKLIVFLAVPGSIRTDWRQEVPAILVNFLPGEQMGPAVYDVLYGVVPPQGKLPVTLPIGENDQKMSPEQYPGTPGGGFVRQAHYTEGLLVGYRW
jgi:beta-glucosidase